MLKKFFKKIRLYKIPPEVQTQIDKEYNTLYEQTRHNLIKLFDDDYKEVYERFFAEYMRREYCIIRDKYLEEYQKNKMKNQNEKEM
ncbi:MAG: hypothetical protein J6A98_01445 [Clostridia bacterium]|nr:hypothetical protein [Clostridia bacterium]